jgi:hypothetical protein
MNEPTRTDSIKGSTTATTDRRGDDTDPSFERFADLARKLIQVPKEEVNEKRVEREKARKHGQN